MLFQVIDDNPSKPIIYVNDRLYKNEIPENISKTYKYSNIFKYRDDSRIEYLEHWSEGKTLDELCPESLKKDWKIICQKIKSFYRAADEVKLNPKKYFLSELVPESVVIEYSQLATQICEHGFLSLTPPPHLGIINCTSKIITDIKNNPLNINYNKEICKDDKYKEIINNLKNKNDYIEYNQFGTITRRLTTKTDSFPVLNLHKPLREIIEPKNDYFLELDMNGFDLRTFLALMEIKQPDEDIHDWNIKNVLKEKNISRSEAKREFFSWFYNPDVINNKLESVYDRNKLNDRYFFGDHVKTPYRDSCEATNFNWLSHLIQRTNSNIFCEQAYTIWKKLLDKKSQIVVLMHDSVLLDVQRSDNINISQIVSDFSNTRFGDFKVNVKKGENWGSMKEYEL